MLKVEVLNEVDGFDVDARRIRRGVKAILRDASVKQAQISIAVVDDATIHRLNRQYLAHDYPTDVLSFLLEREGDYLEGEVITSLDTAKREAVAAGWRAADELLLYVVHGTLHLVGHDDQTLSQRRKMRALERQYLELLGLAPPTKTVKTGSPAGSKRKRSARRPS